MAERTSNRPMVVALVLVVLVAAFGSVGSLAGWLGDADAGGSEAELFDAGALPVADEPATGGLGAGDWTVDAPPIPTTQRPTTSTTEQRTPLAEGSSLVATSRRSEGEVPIWADPQDGEPAWNLSALTEFNGPRHFLVLEETPDWVRVSVPMRPNGTEGWLPKDEVELSVTDYRVQIYLADRSFQVWQGDDLILDTTPAIGNPRAPTPLGNWFIRDIFPWDPDSAYGAYVLALSAYSDSIDQINGGDAVVAIHGTNRPDLLGQAVSLGCVRLHNDDVTVLAQTVPPGTPVEIYG